ncbi:NAD(P)/FAD-dependent oxidoreductase [Oceanospirillum beijerinckii]|uniref:NAD(P)/FAD-dependent oxidoreductase n=1 Tax=Oceanospirillum beijerinckii TaxID=64976 RepID=UPI00040FFD98|nr:FAD-dependent oxidoreductase [Oceanospirillum beijerinckii]
MTIHTSLSPTDSASSLHEALGSNPKTEKTLAIIGAGVVGLCCALQAQARGYQVTLFDRDLPGKGASFGNAGYLATELIDPLSTVDTLKQAPRLWLNPKGPVCLPWNHLLKVLPWLGRFIKAAHPDNARHSREALTQLNRESVPAWQRLLSKVNAQDEIVHAGYLLVWESAQKKTAAQQHMRYMQAVDIPCEYVEGEALAKLEPELAQQLSHGVYFPQASRVKEPYQLCVKLFQAFTDQGGHFIQAEVNQLVPEATLDSGVAKKQVRIKTVCGQTGASCSLTSELSSEHRFDKALLCTGAWGKKLLADLNLKVPLEAERGYHITLPNQQHKLKHAIGSAERRFVLTPLDSGLRAVGMTELGGLKRGPIQRRFNVLKHHTQQLLPTLKSTIEKDCEQWMGHRPTLPDSLPVIDQHPEHSQLLFAFGNQHLGLTQAAATAELILAISEQESPFMPTHYFSVSRF